jgi:hypothetical protein
MNRAPTTEKKQIPRCARDDNEERSLDSAREDGFGEGGSKRGPSTTVGMTQKERSLHWASAKGAEAPVGMTA